MKHDFVVIGAGVAGLTSALILARNGYHVALVEKADRTAPLLRGFSRRGVHFGTGFHYTGGMGKGEPLDIFFRYLGLSDRIASFPFEEKGFDVYRSLEDGFEFHVPSGYESIRERLRDAFPGEESAIGEYLERVRTTFDALPYLNPDADVDSGAALRRVFGPTLKETLDSLTDNRLLKSVLSMHCLLHGVSPEEVSFVQHACIAGSYYLSARGISGGGPALAAEFDAGVRSLGVDVFCGSEAVGMSASSDGGIEGIRLENGTELRCGGCIAAIHPRALLGIAPKGLFRPIYRKRLEGLEDTFSAFMLYSVSDVPLPFLAGRNLFVFPDADSIYRLGERPLEDSPLYITGAYRSPGTEVRGFIGISPALPAQTRAWESSVTGRRPDDYRSFKEGILSRMRRVVDRSCPELAETMGYTEGSTPLTLRDFGNAPTGGLYGVKHKVGQYNPGAATRVKGLYLAGQAVASPGILGAVLSGFMACGTILGHDRLARDLGECH